MDGAGVVFVSGEERETTANETGPAAISLSGVCDRPFAVPLFPGTFFFSFGQNDRLPKIGDLERFALSSFSERCLSTGMHRLGERAALFCRSLECCSENKDYVSRKEQFDVFDSLYPHDLTVVFPPKEQCRHRPFCCVGK